MMKVLFLALVVAAVTVGGLWYAVPDKEARAAAQERAMLERERVEAVAAHRAVVAARRDADMLADARAVIAAHGADTVDGVTVSVPRAKPAAPVRKYDVCVRSDMADRGVPMCRGMLTASRFLRMVGDGDEWGLKQSLPGWLADGSCRWLPGGTKLQVSVSADSPSIAVFDGHRMWQVHKSTVEAC